jgi:hypothetical protein
MEKYFVKNIENKLILCSRNIQVGDDFQDENGNKFVCTSIDKVYPHKSIYSEGKWEKDWHDKTKCFKVIGEISPDATWVTEGMEFEEAEVKRIAIGISNPIGSKYHIYQIKGPCGHFH